VQTEREYRWWPTYRKGVVEYDGRYVFFPFLVAESAFAAVLCLPPVVRATGIAPWQALTLIAVHLAFVALGGFPLHRMAQTSSRAFHLQVGMTLLYNVGLGLALITLGGEPKTPLWMALLTYACISGASQEIEASYGFLAIVTCAPLLTIPIFVAQGASPTWSIAGPALAASFSGLAYHGLAASSAGWRIERGRLRKRVTELERRNLARDLHDSIGSSLSLVGLYGDLIERNAGKPEELKRIAGTLREAARDGLGEMRGLLDALAPTSSDVAGLETSLRRLGDRAVATGVDVQLSVDGPVNTVLDGPQRLTLLRAFQESLNNAIRHGGAHTITSRLQVQAAAAALVLSIEDDGSGFDLATHTPGRGLVGMKARAAELGGEFEMQTHPGGGSRVTLTLPLRAPTIDPSPPER